MSDQQPSNDQSRATQALTDFVKEDPNSLYTLDGQGGLVCRTTANGRRDCLRVKLDQKSMFTLMQKLDFFCTLPIDPEHTHLECKKV
ncbi:hypothetical protein IWQ62_005637 [Dispira parvispora]|uniref:Uncharacterized protein n=1 Tax=Dispira parvispora TaxID=1520584 RepID=A0A9W8AQK2_9FUNG|nr:hypothetical protein IWQ62_005637 [Dispira parvispora]